MSAKFLGIFLAAAILVSHRAWGVPQQPAGEPVVDPVAEKAFAEFVSAYRKLPAVKVKSTATVTTMDGDVESKGQPVEAEIVHGFVDGKMDGPRRGILKLRGYTMWLGDGNIAAVHDSNPATYLTTVDGGSPFYAMLGAFVDLPYPDLALAFGEQDPVEVLMQLNPKAPNVVPVGVVDETIEGKARRTLKFAADGETIELAIDPATNLPLSMNVRITGGTLVPAGGTLAYAHTFAYELPAMPFGVADFAFEPGKRQKVDLLPALVKRPDPPAGGGPGEGGELRHALLGQPLPALVLPLLDQGTFDTARTKGRVLVLDFWATWCGPCKAALPRLHEVAAEFKKDDAPVSFVTVNVFEQQKDLEKRREMIGDYWRGAKFTLPVALDTEGVAGRTFQIAAVPMTVVVRSDGIVHAVHTDFNRERLVADVKSALEALEAKPDAAKADEPAKGP